MLKHPKPILAPVDRLSEALFGLVMVLTATCSFSIAQGGTAEARTMFVGAVGSGIAWGIVDGVMYLVGRLIEQAQDLSVIRQAKPDEAPDRPRLARKDWLGALRVLLIVILATVPVAIPFLLFNRLGVALRVSNATAVTMLFFVGFKLGKDLGYPPLRLGFGMVLLGLLLVAVTVALGG